jgi:hypothetical protein
VFYRKKTETENIEKKRKMINKLAKHFKKVGHVGLTTGVSLIKKKKSQIEQRCKKLKVQ